MPGGVSVDARPVNRCFTSGTVAAVPSRMARVTRLVSPATLALALFVFLLPFLSVSCDTPNGFGRMEAGGTTSYTGLDLATGLSPSVDDDKLRPVEQQTDDDLGFQPLVAVAAILVAVAFGLALAGRFGLTAGVAAAGWTVLVIGVLLARSSLVDLVAAQASEPFADGTTASDYVAVGPGFWIAALLTAVGAGSAFAADRSKSPSAAQ